VSSCVPMRALAHSRTRRPSQVEDLTEGTCPVRAALGQRRSANHAKSVNADDRAHKAAAVLGRMLKRW
jgi:hypothetical protein